MTRPRLQLVAHLSREALETGYRQAQDPIERSHWQIIWLFDQYQDTKKVAELTAYCPDWVRKLIKRYNQDGINALRDLRHQNPGGSQILNQEQLNALNQALKTQAPGDSLWTSAKVAVWIGQTTGRTVSSVTGWKYLKRLDHTLQIPRPKHQKAASVEEQEGFKKNSSKKSKT
jgi:transposase